MAKPPEVSDKNNLNSPEMDELWQLFAQEERDNLDLTEDALLRLEKNFSDAEQIAVLFRSIHSLKGGARMMGLSVLEETVHHAENLAALMRDAGVKADEEIIDILLKTTDLIRQQLAVVLEKRCDVSPETTESMARQLEELIDRKKRGKANAPQTMPPELPTPQNVEEEVNPDA
jgi:chemotaxis protein histidine kinase CheA